MLQSYGCLRVSFIALLIESGILIDINPLLAFKVFASSSHTGHVIKLWKEFCLGQWKLHPVQSISLWTEDGAAPNIKSSKLLGAPYETCAPHHVRARASTRTQHVHTPPQFILFSASAHA